MGELYERLGGVAMARENYPESIALFQRAIQSFEQAAEPDEIGLVPAVTQLARAHWRNGGRADAQMAMARATAIQRAAIAREPEGSIPDGEVPEAMGNDEWLLYQGDAEEAVKGFRGKIVFEEQSRRQIDPEPMPYWEKLAEAEQMLGNLAAAREAFRRAAQEWERHTSPGHPRAEWCRRRSAIVGVDDLPDHRWQGPDPGARVSHR
ncbi:MAG: tetratricopeptide repeat protein [Acidobacteria bacterium]|nr:tetratricopeptide repeat protein [Acidobacteriota bacterium]